jgi:hypothetical protein
MAAKPADIKAKQRKQKIILGAGGVLLLLLLAFQLPKLMKGSPPPPAGSLSASGAATPTASTGAPASLAGTATFAASKEKLTSFTLFKHKDPFVPLVSDAAASGDSSGSSLGTSAGTTPTPVEGAPAPGTATVTTGSGPLYGTVSGSSPKAGAGAAGGTSGKKPAALPGAVVKVNGVKMHVQLGDTFPEAKPIFRLAGITSGSAQIALVKGGLADGSAALTVQKNHPMTLVNTADNKRYTIVFLSSNKT